MTTLPNPSLVPYMVAITGHRDLRPQDVEPLRREVREIFSGMRKRMPSTPLVLLSGLAEGADQLVADVALEQGVLIAAVMPMPLPIYRVQMSADAQTHLDELIARSIVQIELPHDVHSEDEIRASEQARATCYENLALYLARHGQVLIALWDGTRSQKLGGTSTVVHYVRSGTLNEDPEAAESRCGIVYHVITPRISNGDAAPAIATRTLGCEYSSAKVDAIAGSTKHDDLNVQIHNRLELNLDRFNYESLKLENQQLKSDFSLLDAGVPMSPFQKRLQILYRQADAISVDANLSRKHVLFGILCCAIAGTLFYGIHGELLEANPVLWFSFAFFVMLAMLLHWRARRKYIEQRYLDARALAEALRVQFFWDLAGIKQSVDRHYLVHHRTELDWIRFALKNIWLLHQGIDEDPAPAANITAALDSWVKNQAAWYRARADRQSQTVRLREQVSRYGILAAVLWSVLVPAIILIHWPWLKESLSKELGSRSWIIQGCHVALAVPALLASAFRIWIEQVGYEEQSREYRLIERQFSTKATELEKHIASPELAQKLLLELGIEALNENGRWLLLHRERPLEVLSSP